MSATNVATDPVAKAHVGRKSRRSVNTFPLIAPSVIVLVLWMIVPLAMTLWFSFQRYNLIVPTIQGFAGWENYQYLITDPALWTAMKNTLLLVGWVLALTVALGVLLAILLDQDFWGRGVARLFVIAPFFIMPTVSALVWKNLLMHPVNGLFAWITSSLGMGRIDWFASLPLTSIIIIVAWQWGPVRDPHPAHRDPVARRGTEGSGKDGRGRSPLRCSGSSSCPISAAPSRSSS